MALVLVVALTTSKSIDMPLTLAVNGRTGSEPGTVLSEYSNVSTFKMLLDAAGRPTRWLSTIIAFIIATNCSYQSGFDWSSHKTVTVDRLFPL